MVATGLVSVLPPHPTPRRGTAGAGGAGSEGGAASEGPAVAEGRAGREQLPPWCISLPRCGHSRRSAITSRSEHTYLTFGTSFFATRDRKGAAKELHDQLESLGVSVWFSERGVSLSSKLRFEIDKGLAKSRIGIVLVTPALLSRPAGEGIADKELSALLARDLLVPIVHDTTYEALRDVNSLLGSRSGLNTAEDTMENVAAKLAELVSP
jgi:hypothetical protein